MGIIDLLFPKYCVNCRKLGYYLCDNCFSLLEFDEYLKCVVCVKYSKLGITHEHCKRIDSVDGVFIGILQNNIGKKLVSSFSSKPFLSDLNTFLSKLAYEAIIQQEGFLKAILDSHLNIMCPMPVSSKELRKRGYNSSLLLSKEIAKYFNFKLINLFSLRENRLVIKKSYLPLIKGNTFFIVVDIYKDSVEFNKMSYFLKSKKAKAVFVLALASL